MKIKYNYYGNGKETVLFLHGWGLNQNSFNFFCQNLKSKYKILQIDFCGHGDSEKLIYPFFVFDYTVEVFKILKRLNIKCVNIVCHSFGCRVAIMLETFFNIKISKLFISGGAGVKPRFNIITKIKIYNYKFKKYLNKLGIARFKIHNVGSCDYVVLDNVSKQTFVNIVNYNQKKYLKFLQAKTMLLWGDRDDSTPLYMAKIMHKNINNSNIKIIKNGDHFCMFKFSAISLNLLHNFLDN